MKSKFVLLSNMLSKRVCAACRQPVLKKTRQDSDSFFDHHYIYGYREQLTSEIHLDLSIFQIQS